jgi:hypothetical protein
MKRVFPQLAKIKPRFFKVNYSPEYQRFIVNHVATDPSHPLYEMQKRRIAERKKEGLWWHVTTGADLAKSSCVRSWARRRLRNAIVEELKARGFDENGKPIERNGFVSGLGAIKGSLRLHVQTPLIPAKFVDVRAEVGNILEVLVDDVPKTLPQMPLVGRPERTPTPRKQSDRSDRTPSVKRPLEWSEKTPSPKKPLIRFQGRISPKTPQKAAQISRA